MTKRPLHSRPGRVRRSLALAIVSLVLPVPAFAQPDPDAPAPPPTATPTAPPAPPPAPPAPPEAPPPATPPVASARPPSADPPAARPPSGATEAAGQEVSPTAGVLAPVFPEDRPPPVDPQDPNAIRFNVHGYFRAPFRMSWRRRGQTKENEGKYDLRTPWLVDDDYFRSGFGYLPLNESDWSEIYLNVGNKHLTGTLTLFASLFSDSAKAIIDRQGGIAQGYVTFRHEPEVFGQKVRVRIKGGSFWDRFGWLEKYDTYLFGRIHQLGEQTRFETDFGKLTLSALHGVGAHVESIEANQGLSLINYLRLGAAYDKTVEGGVYYLRSWTQDKRQLKEIADASLRAIGVDARVKHPLAGRLYAGTSLVKAEQGRYLTPSMELMHSFGGRGIEENFLGTQKSENGTGELWNVALQYDYSLSNLLRELDKKGPPPLGGAEIGLSVFGVYTFAQSKQGDLDPTINRDDKKYFKWGAELATWPLSWLGASIRYDRVVLDVDDEANTYRVFSPRVSLRTHWMGDALIFFQWSRYSYGDRVKLRPGQIALENQPDDNAIKIQAQMSF